MNESDNSIDNSTVEDETQESKDETKEFCNDPAYCITHCDGPVAALMVFWLHLKTYGEF